MWCFMLLIGLSLLIVGFFIGIVAHLEYLAVSLGKDEAAQWGARKRMFIGGAMLIIAMLILYFVFTNAPE